ncbi:hypothetical protein [Dactylosporangium darangshiense]|uniref:DUF998 domain-containing protein n=1 Tax=Dactylosporangium darangshiense TaxID=579108 RepID=A0ABP8CSR7_9ACTN
MQLALSCVPPTFNIAATSAAYAQMAGLLSGFAFTALVMLLKPTRSRRRRPEDQLPVALFAAFVALLLSTLTYSLLAGEDVVGARARTATEELVDGLPFGLAFIMLLHGLTFLLDSGGAGRALVRAVHVITVLVLPALTMLYLVNAVPDMESARAQLAGGCPSTSMYTFGLILTALTIAVLGAMLVARSRWPRFRDWTPRRPDAAPFLVLVVCIASAVCAGFLASRSPNFLFPSAGLATFLELAWLLLTGIGTVLIASWPPPKAPDPPTGRIGRHRSRTRAASTAN